MFRIADKEGAHGKRGSTIYFKNEGHKKCMMIKVELASTPFLDRNSISNRFQFVTQVTSGQNSLFQ